MVDVCRPSVIRAVANREVMENSAEYVKPLLEIPGENLISVLNKDRPPESLLIGQLLRSLSLFPLCRPQLPASSRMERIISPPIPEMTSVTCASPNCSR